MTPAKPYTACANGCGVPAKWQVVRNKRHINLCNGCVTKSNRQPKVPETRAEAEAARKREVLRRVLR